jgi:hypothetical protein
MGPVSDPEPRNHCQCSNCSRRRVISALGCTPTIRSTSRPPRKKSRAGMLRMLKRFVVTGFSSILSFATRTRPAISAARSSSIGLIARQGPHHGAHRSTSTGIDARSTSAENVASVTITGLPSVRRGVLHFPQTGRRPCSNLSGGTRFFAPQARHGITSASAIFYLYSVMAVVLTLHSRRYINFQKRARNARNHLDRPNQRRTRRGCDTQSGPGRVLAVVRRSRDRDVDLRPRFHSRAGSTIQRSAGHPVAAGDALGRIHIRRLLGG